jgi:hypothetical protein
MRCAAITVVVIGCLVQAGDTATKSVELLHAPRYVFYDTPVSFDVRAVPAAVNRLLIVAAIDEYGTTVRRSDEDLAGDTARVTRRIDWDTFGEGSYTLVARVYDGAGVSCVRKDGDGWPFCTARAGESRVLEVFGPDGP